jgi:hypothetical protein
MGPCHFWVRIDELPMKPSRLSQHPPSVYAASREVRIRFQSFRREPAPSTMLWGILLPMAGCRCSTRKLSKTLYAGLRMRRRAEQI